MGWVNVSLPEVADDVMEGERCFLGERRMMPVPAVGMKDPELRGVWAFGGVLLTGPGSLLRAWCTRCSSRCICPMRPRIWCSDREGGSGMAVLIAVLNDGPRFWRDLGK